MSDLVPDGWRIETLSSNTSLITKGATPTTYGYNYVESLTEGGARFIRGNNATIHGKFKGTDVKYICSDAHNQLKRSKLALGDIIISIVGSVGTSFLVEEDVIPGNINQNVALVRPMKTLDSGYLKQVIVSDIIQDIIANELTVQAQPSLSLKQIGDFSIPVPPLPEQQKIAAILSSVDDVIEKTQAQIDKLKDLKTGMMQELLSPREGQAANINNQQGESENGLHHTEFKDSPLGRIPVGWEVVKTGDISKSIVPGRNKPKSLSGDIPWLTIADLDSFYVDKSKKNLGVTYENLREANGKTIPAKSVIMSVVGEFGISSVARCEMVINQQLHGFVCNEDIDPAFLCLSLRHHKLQQERLATQTTIAYMNKDNTESILFAKPPFSQQLKIAASILAVDEKINVLNSKHSSYINTKKALMQDLLTGKVRVTTDEV